MHEWLHERQVGWLVRGVRTFVFKNHYSPMARGVTVLSGSDDDAVIAVPVTRSGPQRSHSILESTS
jgi:hypothetical protein